MVNTGTSQHPLSGPHLIWWQASGGIHCQKRQQVTGMLQILGMPVLPREKGAASSGCLSPKLSRMDHVFVASGQYFLINANTTQTVFAHDWFRLRSDHSLRAVTPYISLFSQDKEINNHLQRWILASLEFPTKTKHYRFYKGNITVSLRTVVFGQSIFVQVFICMSFPCILVQITLV